MWWFLPCIDLNQPSVHMCPPLLNPPPTSLPSHPSGLSQGTSCECPASCIELALVICFTYGTIHVSMLFSQIFLISPCCSLELCIQMGISFLFSFAFCFSSFLSYLSGLFRQSFYHFAFRFHGDGFDHCLLYNVTNLHPSFFILSIRSNPLNLFVIYTI